ncbi:helix-turn-helix domain-containing protein [Kitasatospora sp. NPDC085464]|uniref:helix-turn-helix domain-containing protein n=1 Tax=Kitasatospora sp. NPDC085464 TaxID=3364063 RepID=UPI0037C66405
MSTENTGKYSVGPRLAHPGDTGRRVTERRQQLGLSREEVAERAGVAVGYVEFVESGLVVAGQQLTLRLIMVLGLRRTGRP